MKIMKTVAGVSLLCAVVTGAMAAMPEAPKAEYVPVGANMTAGNGGILFMQNLSSQAYTVTFTQAGYGPQAPKILYPYGTYDQSGRHRLDQVAIENASFPVTAQRNILNTGMYVDTLTAYQQYPSLYVTYPYAPGNNLPAAAHKVVSIQE